jgi:3D (Asp-Asp-Asp) domain-containing protein
MNVSAYCETGNRTASGVYPTAGITCAADHLPFGATVTVDGNKYTVQDRFGGGYTDRLDLFMLTEAECWDFGRQWLMCEIEY